jgi:hypothetical protein
METSWNSPPVPVPVCVPVPVHATVSRLWLSWEAFMYSADYYSILSALLVLLQVVHDVRSENTFVYLLLHGENLR